jgi:hypothetical protein
MASLNTFRSKYLLKKLHMLHSHDFLMTNSSLYPTHAIICKVPQSSSEFQTQIQPQRPGRFSNSFQRRAPIGKWIKKTDIEHHFEHGEVIQIHVGWCINTPSHYKNTGIISNSFARQEVNPSGILQ